MAVEAAAVTKATAEAAEAEAVEAEKEVEVGGGRWETGGVGGGRRAAQRLGRRVDDALELARRVEQARHEVSTCLALLGGLLHMNLGGLRQLLRPADLTALSPAGLQRHVLMRTPLLLLLNDQLLLYYCLAMINTVSASRSQWWLGLGLASPMPYSEPRP